LLALLALRFTDTVTLGGALIASAVAFAALARLVIAVPRRAENESLKRQLEEMRGEVADCGRRITDLRDRVEELRAEKEGEAQRRAAADARSDALEKSVHDFAGFVQLQTEGLRHSDEAAALRQSKIVELIETHELRAVDRHSDLRRDAAATTEVLHAIANRLEEMSPPNERSPDDF
jgi:chromosome segregation ATPase